MVGAVDHSSGGPTDDTAKEEMPQMRPVDPGLAMDAALKGSLERQRPSQGSEASQSVQSGPTVESGPAVDAAAGTPSQRPNPHVAPQVMQQASRHGESSAQQASIGNRGRYNAPEAQAATRARSKFSSFVNSYASFFNGFVFSFSLLLIIPTLQLGVALSRQGALTPSFEALKETSLLLFGNFILPFTESVVPPVHADPQHFHVWSFWIPGLLGVSLLLTAGLGFASLMAAAEKRHSLLIVPYVALAVVFLVWQIEVSQILSEIAFHEHVIPDIDTIAAKNFSETQVIQFHMYQMTWDAFAQFYKIQQCSTVPPVNSGSWLQAQPGRISCKKDSPEAHLLQIAVNEFCRTRKKAEVSDFTERSNRCQAQGQRLRILPSKDSSRKDKSMVFCRCRTALFEWLRWISRWIMVAWVMELLGVCAVMYVSAEPKLLRMGARERLEVVGICVLGIAVLVAKVTILSDGPLRRRRSITG